MGGLAGYVDNTGSIATSYSTGTVQMVANSSVGGSVGGLLGTATNHYWDTDTSGITGLSQGAGNVANAPGIKGLKSPKLRAALPAGFSSSVWAESASGNNGFPYLAQLSPRAAGALAATARQPGTR